MSASNNVAELIVMFKNFLMLRRISFWSLLCLVTLLFACNKDGVGTADGSFLAGGGPSAGGSGGSGGSGSGNAQPGVITAGEWNDNNNWSFWNKLMDSVRWRDMQPYWRFYMHQPLKVQLYDANGKPIVDAIISLSNASNQVVWTSRTDNGGSAICTPSLFSPQAILSGLTATAKIAGVDYAIGAFNGTTVLQKSLLITGPKRSKMDIMFVVDATGSMGDEISYLKTELFDVLQRAGGELPQMGIRVGSVFYRDEGDDYVTRNYNFTGNTGDLIEFIRRQQADGGGDFPEAVHSALEVAIRQQSWSAEAQGRLLFLILDAPPHKKDQVINSLQESVRRAASLGIKIIPITASGIDKETEFLMRFMAISTNGTYVFITNDSGIGNPHLSPTVGPYTVEFLNNLMVRLIKKYGM